jgi:hypothetical protein
MVEMRKKQAKLKNCIQFVSTFYAVELRVSCGGQASAGAATEKRFNIK